MNNHNLSGDEVLTGSAFPLGFSTVTLTVPLPAENVSTVKFVLAPTTGPVGSIPGPYTRTLNGNKDNIIHSEYLNYKNAFLLNRNKIQ